MVPSQPLKSREHLGVQRKAMPSKRAGAAQGRCKISNTLCMSIPHPALVVWTVSTSAGTTRHALVMAASSSIQMAAQDHVSNPKKATVRELQNVVRRSAQTWGHGLLAKLPRQRFVLTSVKPFGKGVKASIPMSQHAAKLSPQRLAPLKRTLH
jgi:hypothetical protein